MSSHLPAELITEILLCLPVKHLIRFKCLSKLFYSIIDSSNFIKTHLSKSIQTDTHLNLILSHHPEDDNNCDDSIFASDINNGLPETALLSNPLKSAYGSTAIKGSCNGLLLLYNDWYNLVLWNPFTRRFKKLPFCPNDLEAYLVVNYLGFGYDSAGDDYKVVRILASAWASDEDSPKHVWVYTLRGNYWKRVEDFPFRRYNLYWEEPAWYANGVLYWQCRKGNKERIIAFDVETELFSEIPRPHYTFNKKEKKQPIPIPSLGVVGGCLCSDVFFMSEEDYDVSCNKIERYIWKKDDDGGEFS